MVTRDDQAGPDEDQNVGDIRHVQLTPNSLYRFSLRFFNETHGMGGGPAGPWGNLCVDLPPQYYSTQAYSATLGHKEIGVRLH